MNRMPAHRAVIAIAIGTWLVVLSPVNAASTDKVTPVQSPLPLGAVTHVGGYVGQRIHANIKGSLKAFDIDKHVRMVEEKKSRAWFWIGEQPGKWLDSSVRAGMAGGDASLDARAHQILSRLIAAQEPGGYLGITDPAVRTDAQPLRGMDPYELYFTLHGLLTAAEAWNDPKALDAARRLGDYFVSHIGPGKAEFWPSPLREADNKNTIVCKQYTWVPPGTRKAPQLYVHSEIAGHTAHYGWEGTLLVDPMLRLHQATGDARYRDWSKWVIDSIDRWSGWDSFSRLDQVAEGKIGVHQLQPYVHSHTFQMNFLGFLRMYQVTGDESYLRKVRGAWDDIMRRQVYITGGVSVGEHYEIGCKRPATGAVVETCANMSWMQLNQSLLQLTGEPRFADAIERLLFNHVFASQTIDGDSYRYHTPPNGFKPEQYFHGPDCCTSSGHRIVAMLPEFIYSQGKDAACVNQFVPSTAQFQFTAGRVTLKQETLYPESDTVVVHVETDRDIPFALHVRIPAWCETPSLQLNDQPVPDVKPGSYAVLNRTWQRGDRVKLVLSMQPRWIQHDHFEGGPAPWALVRGPLVYAVDTVWWNDPAIAAPSDAGKEVAAIRLNAQLHPKPATPGALGPFYETQVQLLDGRTAQATFVPFSNVGRWYRDGQPKPDRRSRAFSYAVWLRDSTSPDAVHSGQR